jgi:hypothetical protein
LLLVQNAAPATSVTVVDPTSKKQLEVPTPGCYGIYPALSQPRRFTTLCGNGTMGTCTINAKLTGAERRTGAKGLDADADPLFIHAERDADAHVFLSFKGDLHGKRLVTRSPATNLTSITLSPADPTVLLAVNPLHPPAALATAPSARSRLPGRPGRGRYSSSPPRFVRPFAECDLNTNRRARSRSSRMATTSSCAIVNPRSGKVTPLSRPEIHIRIGT